MERERNYSDKRNIFFQLTYSKLWPTSVWKLVMKLRNKHELGRIRLRMSYHTFPNFSQLLQGDLVRKLNEGIYSLDFVDRICNCNKNNLDKNEEYMYGGNAGSLASFIKQRIRLRGDSTLVLQRTV